MLVLSQLETQWAMLQYSVPSSTPLCARYGLMHSDPGLVSIAMSEKSSKDQGTDYERL